MNEKTKKSSKAESGPCLCGGAGPALSDAVRRIAPSDEARRHFDAARVEVLKGLRTILDARIEHFSKKAAAKGQKINVD
jgi:hypothetical protein